MSETLVVVLTILGMSLLVGVSGVWFASREKNKASSRGLELLVALGAGALFAITFFDFLPHISENSYVSGRPFHYFLFAGILFIILAEWVMLPLLANLDVMFFRPKKVCAHTEDHHHDEHLNVDHHHVHLVSGHSACSALGCLIICCFFDGIQIYSSFRLGVSTGIMTSTSLLLHLLPDGVMVAGLALAAGFSKTTAKLFSGFVGGSLLLGGACAFLLGNALGVRSVLLPFASGVLIYVCFSHLLPIASRPKHRWLFLVALTLCVAFIQVSHLGH